jgi:ribosome-associated toxin RatA of RatAB toxin-antitoxin module
MIFRSFLPSVTKKYVQRQILSTHPLHLFRIIQDVDRYADFLPHCSYSKVDQRTSPHAFEATLTVGLPPVFSETYQSRVTVKPEQLVIESDCRQGKYFDRLRSSWKLRAVAQSPQPESTTVRLLACEVDFSVEITASDPLIVSILDRILEQIAGDQVRAFDQRCRQIPLANDLSDKDTPQ